jgi:hypothetical protein
MEGSLPRGTVPVTPAAFPVGPESPIVDRRLVKFILHPGGSQCDARWRLCRSGQFL